MKTLIDTLKELHDQYGDKVAVSDGGTTWYIPTLISEGNQDFQAEAYAVSNEIVLWENDGFTSKVFDVLLGKWDIDSDEFIENEA